ncbi:MAG: DUF2249 domain-containing protein [Desulfatiglandales bacterium]|nr:DUF2249 domain-containing protein [Desulfatiglandales bacterium]
MNERRVIPVDCREMQAPEPMIAVLEAVSGMQENEAVLMLHRQKPIHLFPKLEDSGLCYELEEEEDGSIQLLIWQESS